MSLGSFLGSIAETVVKKGIGAAANTIVGSAFGGSTKPTQAKLPTFSRSPPGVGRFLIRMPLDTSPARRPSGSVTSGDSESAIRLARIHALIMEGVDAPTSSGRLRSSSLTV